MLQVQNEVRQFIARTRMISRGDRVIIGVSGGADSTALLHVLVQLGGILRAKYRVVHVHHGIRGAEADRDAKYVEALCRKYKEPNVVINSVESHHGDVEPQSLIACLVQAADTISAARPGARRETVETYTTRLKKLEDIANSYKGVDKSFAIQAGREIRIMVVPEQITDDDMVLLARDISKRIQDELQYPGQIKVNVIRESRVTEYAK